jgi:phage I-like protein
MSIQSDQFRFLPFQLSEKLNNDLPGKIQILKTGEFNHEGRDIKITGKDLEKMITNFGEKVRGIDLMIDFSHNSDGEAAGWIKDLQLNEAGTELWATVDWTPSGKEAIQSKSFRYISADFSFNYKDNETKKDFGVTLMGAALTNRPVVKKMKPVILSEKKDININRKDKKMAENEKEYEEKIEDNEELQKEDALTLEDCKKLIEELKAQLKAKQEEIDAYNSKMAQDQEEKEKEMEKLAEEKKLSEKNALFDLKMAEGHVVEAQRQSFIDNDMEKFIELQSETKLSEKGISAPKQEEKITSENVENKVLELAEVKMKDKNIPWDIAISEILKENEKLNEMYNNKLS